MNDNNPQQGMSDEEARKYVEQLREAPADQVLADVLIGVVNAAQVKLGRPDARIFIDVSATLLDNVRAHLPDAIATQVDQALGQLRLAQVQAEADEASRGADQTSGTSGTESAAADPQPSEPAKPQSKLWVPGDPM